MVYTLSDEKLNFQSFEDRLLPHNLEAEESVLGSILLDMGAIYRVRDNLKPEHFFLSAHQDIYAACIKLAKRQKSTDVLSIVDYLASNGLLERIGGRNKLHNLLDRTVSTVNVDKIAELVINYSIRRQIIRLGSNFQAFGFATEIEIPELLSKLKENTRLITECPQGQSDQDVRGWHYNRLLQELQDIYLRISDPGRKLYELQELANRTPGRGVRDLENLYLKSLCATVEPRRSLDELEEEVGTEGRRWVLGGLIPEATTMLLYADGGVGKTKLMYDVLYAIASGENWNGFPATAPNRRVLIYQGDESKHDMLQALNKRGFTEGTEVRNRTAVRFGWNTDAIPILYQDIEEYDPAVIMIDSLTFVNRYSIYDENSTEYSRPVMELNKIAALTGKTIVIVHHANRGGKARGATAIFNAVSEVLKLEKDTSAGANPQEKILTIEKSRSRRFPCQYKLFFNEEDFSLSLLEEVGTLGADTPTKDKIMKFFETNRNQKYQAEEVAYFVSTTDNNARRCLSQLARDGILSCDEKHKRGTAKLYYLPWGNDKCSIHSSQHNLTKNDIYVHNSQTAQDVDQQRSEVDFTTMYPSQCTTHAQPHAQLSCTTCNPDGVSKVPEVMHVSTPNSENLDSGKNLGGGHANLEIVPTSNDCEASVPELCIEVVHGLCTENDLKDKTTSNDCEASVPELCIEVVHQVVHPVDPAITKKSTLQSDVVQKCPYCPQTGLPMNPPHQMAINTPLGTVTVKATSLKIRGDHKVETVMEYILPNGNSKTKNAAIGKGKADIEAIAREEVSRWIPAALLKAQKAGQTFRVRQMRGTMLEPEYAWVPGCKLLRLPNPPELNQYMLQAPDAEIFGVYEDSFELDH
ncbi:AAA family ATPase [Plectonema radiosum NIES-515]|uniref:AAA family ATPase n=1 Tax=Plectonema radiosum NIES-515 TaxID=2986073 RepID=A0ABT3B162_9CYAN|nr:DnaB-like helicase N-terminal domain-containing protein [Plectonema radiosum]MCV3215102.1 AAA family ATPase [Plectonema radiosum NIES-515]